MIFDSQVSYFLLIGFLGFWHGVQAANVLSFGSDLGGARNIVLVQGFEAFGNGLGGFVAPPITSKFQISHFFLSVDKVFDSSTSTVSVMKWDVVLYNTHRRSLKAW